MTCPTCKQRILTADDSSKGGLAAAAKLTPEERKAKASKASLVRWGKRRAVDSQLNASDQATVSTKS